MAEYNQQEKLLSYLSGLTETIRIVREGLKLVRIDSRTVLPGINPTSLTPESLAKIDHEYCTLESCEQSLRAIILKETSRGSGPGTYDPNITVGQDDRARRNEDLSMFLTEMDAQVNDPGKNDNFKNTMSFNRVSMMFQGTTVIGYLCTFQGCKPDTIFRYKSKYEDHHLVHCPGNYKCHPCGLAFRRERSLEKHKKTKQHLGTKTGANVRRTRTVGSRRPISIGSSSSRTSSQPPLDLAIAQPGLQLVNASTQSDGPGTYDANTQSDNFEPGYQPSPGYSAGQSHQSQEQIQHYGLRAEQSFHPERLSPQLQIEGAEEPFDNCIDPALGGLEYCTLSDVQRNSEISSPSSGFTFDLDMLITDGASSQ